jgi:hypothetical protein
MSVADRPSGLPVARFSFCIRTQPDRMRTPLAPVSPGFAENKPPRYWKPSKPRSELAMRVIYVAAASQVQWPVDGWNLVLIMAF